MINDKARTTNVIGHGIDLVKIERIKQMVQAHGDHFLSRCFTDDELRYSQANSKRHIEHLAGRFAAKEAIFKALGTGCSGGIQWIDASIKRAGNGKPQVVLTAKALEVAGAQGITGWKISISHTKEHAMASAIATG